MDKTYFRKFALAIFIDREGNALIQKRERHSKDGEKYGLYGGGIEPGETSDTAITRELKEELGLKISNPKIWKTMDIQVDKHGLGYFAIYIFPLTEEIENSKDFEGEKYFSTIKDLSEFKEFDEIDKNFFRLVLNDWNNILDNFI